MTKVAGVLVIGAGIALLSGCAGAEDGGEAEPLADYIGYSPLASEHANAVALAESNKLTDEEKRRKRAVEDFVARCMRDAGFEYVPQYPEDLEDREPYPIEVEASMSPEAFAEQYGYGLSTFPHSTGPVDPNFAIREGLSPEAQQAYDEALWGDDGCHGKADNEVNDDADSEELRIQKEFEGLAEDIGRLHQRLQDDPRMRDALTGWADCMADGGYPGLEEVVDATNLVSERLDAGAREDPKKLREVQAFELAVAAVDVACQQEHVETVRAEVATRLEKQFVAEHKAELERFRERAGDSGIMLGSST